MSKECRPSGDEGTGDGLAQGFWALAGSGFGKLADEPCCFFAPTASCFNAKKRPSGSDLAGRVLGTSVPWTFAHPVVPFLRIVLCGVGVQLAGEGGNDGGVNG